jgi:glycerophosphoryl diester phosphodiesterase
MPKTIVFLQFFVDCIQWLIPRGQPHLEKINNVKIVAHRGCFNNQETLENTMKAFDSAVSKKIYGIEFDVRWTKDNIPIIHHDESLARIFKSPKKIKDLSFDQLRAEFPEVPSLAEVISKHGSQIHFFIELKLEEFKDLEIKKAYLKELLSPLTPGDDFHIFALHECVLLDFMIFDKKFYLTISNTNTKKISEMTKKHQFGGMTGHYLLITNKLFHSHKKLEHKIGTGFPRNKSTLVKEINRGVDFIFTNHTDELLKALKELKS